GRGLSKGPRNLRLFGRGFRTGPRDSSGAPNERGSALRSPLDGRQTHTSTINYLGLIDQRDSKVVRTIHAYTSAVETNNHASARAGWTTLELPEDIAQGLETKWTDLPRAALES